MVCNEFSLIIFNIDANAYLDGDILHCVKLPAKNNLTAYYYDTISFKEVVVAQLQSP